MYLNTKVDPNLHLKVDTIFCTDLMRYSAGVVKLLKQYSTDKRYIAIERIRHSIVLDTAIIREIADCWFAHTVGQEMHALYIETQKNFTDILEIVEDEFETNTEQK